MLKRSLCYPNDLRKLMTLVITFGMTFSFIYIITLNYSHVNVSESIIMYRENHLLNLKYNGSLTQNRCNFGKNGPRILCAVFTYQKNYATKATAVNNTWGNLIFETMIS
jgi:hypothetical protein